MSHIMVTHGYVDVDRNRAQTAKSPIMPTNEIETEPRSNDANIFSTRADCDVITIFAPTGILNALFLALHPHTCVPILMRKKEQ